MKNNELTNKVIGSCFLAGCLKMYDFIIFGLFAPIIHKNYLSFLDSDSSLIITYALFAVGFIFRPIGSIIFGYIGDVYGRKPAIVLSVTLMGIASLGMFVLPTYNLIGISACYLIAAIRILQGISVGGEYNGATIYAIEHSDKKNIGFVGAFVTAGSMLGIVLATLVSKVLQNPSLPEYSWRFAFLIGFGLSIIGYMIRKALRESPVFQEIAVKKRVIPIIEGVKAYKKEFLAAILVAGASNTSCYFALIFAPNYIKAKSVFNLDNLSILMTCIMFVCIPIAGWLSDRFDRNKMIVATCFGASICNLFFLNCLLSADTKATIIIYTILYSVIIAMLVATVNVYVLAIFPAKYRFSCASFGYSIGAILGGLAPMLLASITQYFGNNPLYLGIYVGVVCMFGSAGGLLLIPRHGSFNIRS